MPHEFVVGAFEPGDDDVADFMLDRWLPFAVNECNWVANRAPAPGVRPNVEVWTHRGTVGTPETPFYFAHTSAQHMHIFTGDDVDLTQEIYDQPNNPANAPRDASFTVPASGNIGNTMRCMFINSMAGPYQGYWLFSDTTGEYIHCVVKVSARQYRHFHIGRLKQVDGGPDLDPSSFYVTSHFWNELDPGPLNYPVNASNLSEHSPYINQHMVPFRNYAGTNQNGSFGTGMPNTLPPARYYIPGLFPIQINAAAVTNGGTGHAVNDIITVSLTDGVYAGTGTPATLRVTAETGGVIDTVSIETVGNYDRQTGSGDFIPVTGIDQASTTGTGVGATFSLTFEGYKFFSAAPNDELQAESAPAQKSGDGGATNSVGDVMLRSRLGSCQTNFYDAGLGAILFAADRNFTANANVLVPIYIGVQFDFQSDTRLGIVAQVPDVFRVNMRDYAPEQTITVQGNDYKVFPMINKDSNNTVAGEGYSGYEGIAYRVETGPVV